MVAIVLGESVEVVVVVVVGTGRKERMKVKLKSKSYAHNGFTVYKGCALHFQQSAIQ